jgi:hypothetical protein
VSSAVFARAYALGSSDEPQPESAAPSAATRRARRTTAT